MLTGRVDDLEAGTEVAKIATKYYQKFGKDVVIDMFCYRRFGHNESDEPMFAQPLIYKKIKGHSYGLMLPAGSDSFRFDHQIKFKNHCLSCK